MAFDLITVALFGHPDPTVGERMRTPYARAIEADNFDVHAYSSDVSLGVVLSDVRPHVIFTFGRVEDFPHLLATPIDVRRRWIHFAPPYPDPAELAVAAERAFVDIATNDRFPELPLVSVFTPTYRTGERALRPFQSLLDQTYRNWEWVVYDDSPEDDTFDYLRRFADIEPRVRLFRSDRQCGRIGEVKRRCCGLARGSIYVELDHDDELTDHCLSSLVEAFRTFPDSGFAYTDCSEPYEEGGFNWYGETFAFEYGTYREELYRGENHLVQNYPSVNAKTVRHIVGMPNHARAWRADLYHSIGGHGSEIHVVDDYELCLRTFLATRMVHVQRHGYRQYLSRSGGNTQIRRNKEIQRLVRLFQRRYEAQIHARFLELGVDDFIWRDGQLDWSVPNPDPTPIANYILR
jgi:glycosyltransferase involved in cell wall biosynthesis